MPDSSWLWALFTVIAAFSQTVRNAAQRQLTTTLGTVGATHVRFLFGFPFALLFLAGVLIAGGGSLPRPGLAYWAWVADGALAQVAATALMLAAMNQRSFVVTIAYIKTEPVQVALFGLVLLGDAVTPWLALAILVATAGVVVMSLKPGAAAGGLRPTLSGLSAGAGPLSSCSRLKPRRSRREVTTIESNSPERCNRRDANCCRPIPSESIATSDATPTEMPSVVSEFRSTDSRRLRPASSMES